MGDARENKHYWVMVVLAIIVTVGIWQLPFGRTILWPFTLLATWVHEMGHGMAAACLTEFQELEIYKNAGGVAKTFAVRGTSWKNAAIAAAGLLGPALAGAFIIFFGRKQKYARALLWILGGLMAASAAVYVRPWFGFGQLVVGAWAAALIALAQLGNGRVCFFFVQFLGLQFCINNFKDFDYMFTKSFQRDGSVMISDSQRIAENLFMPYWFWGALVAGCSILLLIGALWIANRPKKVSRGSDFE